MSDQYLEELNEALDSENSWRKKELSDIKNKINSIADVGDSNFLIRGGITLTYAHWEGGIRQNLIKYIEFLNKHLEKTESKHIKEEWIIDLVFGEIVKTLGHNTKIKRLKAINKFKERMVENKEIQISTLVNTKSNLDFKIFKNLSENFNIFIEPEVEIEEKSIQKLVRDRNSVAHGENKFMIRDEKDLEKNKELLVEIIEKIIFLLEMFKISILNEAQNFKI